MKKVIYTFGSNTQGRHGKGCAKVALKFYGAKYGQAEGRQGDSYAIVTKELRKSKKKVTLPQIKEGVARFLKYAKEHPELTFDVQPIGCGLAGRTPKQIGPMFFKRTQNVKLPKEFRKYCWSLEERFYRAWKKEFPDLPRPEGQYPLRNPKSGKDWLFDFAWPDWKIAVEIQGGAFIRGGHNRGMGQQRDFEKHNHATLEGWRVLFFNTAMIGQVDDNKIYDCVEMAAMLLTDAKEV